MKVYFASDHAGFELKAKLQEFVRSLGHETEDLGPLALDPGDDYPDYIKPLAERVAAEECSFGVALGGSGEGEAMAANRLGGARAAEYYGGNLDIVRLAREHNNANILSLGARFVSVEEAQAAMELFLNTAFSGDERHIRRIEKLDE
jgi:ribose 5-phosphate isomerase B